MTRSERRLAIRTAALGLVLTLLVLAADLAGAFATLDRWLYDERARHCQFFARPPTTQLVYCDIDDQSLLSVGNLPWPRSKFAEMVDEIRLAGASALAFDVLFAEPQEPTPRVDATTRPAVVTGLIDHDQQLAEAIRRFGNVVLPATFAIGRGESSPLFDDVRAALLADLELTVAEVAARIRASSASPHTEQGVAQVYLGALRAAAFERIDAAMRAAPAATFEQVRPSLLRRTNPDVQASALLKLLRGEYQRWQAQAALARLARPRDAGDNLPPILPTFDTQAPIAPLGRASSGTAFVDYLPSGDGVVRTMPLWLEYRGGLYPQEGLALACAVLGINPADAEQVSITADAVTLSPPGGKRPIVIPVHTIRPGRQRLEAGTCVEIPWTGSSDWVVAYQRWGIDPHLSADIVWQSCETRRGIETNIASVDQALLFVLGQLQKEKEYAQLERHPPPPDDFAPRAKLIESLFAELKATQELDFYLNATAEDRKDEQIARYAAAVRTLDQARRTSPELAERLRRQRDQLRKRLAGKAVLIGWTATAAAGSDFVPTPLHPRAPGMLSHGTIFNGIMTGEMWRRSPAWVGRAVTLLLGLITTAAVAFLPPWKGVFATLAAAGAYLAIDGVLLFDYLDIIPAGAAAGVIAASAAVWSGCTLVKLLVEGIERARITRRFRAYNDPALVDYVLEHAEQEEQLLAGQVRELTIVFTDLRGFTRLTEALGERTVGILNQYFDRMVPIIRANNGLVNKFLGDGIMFFFGAPRENPDHARDAVASILQMQAALAEFNKQLAADGLPQLGMGAGISTSHVVVGDAGSHDRSDYTVLGDGANLASRLESANKYTGTSNLITERTVEMLGDAYVVRPVGRLLVVGKAKPVMAYEAICAAAECSTPQRRRVELTSRMVDAYIAAHFDACLESANELEGEFGPHRLVDLYRKWCERQEALVGSAAFEGQIVLAEK
ncbi:MAG TPA: CHASE2 domain-containing protein [Tepidisphaeraceae bacterium]|nr:CHASE2 domain-containing protein [Tepidisphaeraceae bacterium]